MRPLLAAALLAAFAACGGPGEPEPRFPGVFVIGFDGMEPALVEAEMAAGRMPNFTRLAGRGGYSLLETTLPPESPVAWATFATGEDPGGHGIFDFIHRRILPEGGISLYLSTSDTTPPSSFLPFFGYRLPLRSGETRLLVKGEYFWERLGAAGIPASIVRIPSNYPPRDPDVRSFTGMGTPDVLGSYGVFSYWTDDPPLDAVEMEDTAHVLPVEVEDGRVETELRGPRNSFREGQPYATVPLVVYPDPERGVARLDVGDRTVLLRAGEWGEWVPVRFGLVPGIATSSGIVRFYLKEISPRFRLYASPVNVDPRDPDIEIATPDGESARLADGIGLYYTQGMAEDTQACRHEVLTIEEFLVQAELVLEERRRMLDVEIERFRRLGGFTFFYFSSTDLCAHMLYRYMDPEHPLYDEAEARKHGGELARIYREMDRLLGQVLDGVPEDTRVVVLSDHGFAPLRRQLNLNTWLYENGCLELLYPRRQGEMTRYRNVDWFRTKAYAVGFSGIHLNLAGRELPGFVTPGAEAEELTRDLIGRLEALTDPETGERVVTKVYRREEVYHGPYVEEAPDLIVGFNRGYGCSDDSVNGTVSRELMRDTDDAWSGSHLMDPVHVPGILLVNRPIRLADPRLSDLAASILAEFGIERAGSPSRRIW